MPVQDRDPESDQEKSRERWETEVMEILAASDREPSLSDKARRAATNARYGTRPGIHDQLQSTRHRMSVGALLLVVMLLALTGFALRHISPLLGQLLAFAAIVVFLMLLYKAFFGQRSPGDGPGSSIGGPPGSDSNPTIEAWKNRLRRDDE